MPESSFSKNISYQLIKKGKKVDFKKVQCKGDYSLPISGVKRGYLQNKWIYKECSI